MKKKAKKPNHHGALLRMLANLWQNPEYPTNAKVLWQTLFTHINHKTGLCCPSYAVLTKQLHHHSQWINETILICVSTGLMLPPQQKQGKFNRPYNLYSLLSPRPPKGKSVSESPNIVPFPAQTSIGLTRSTTRKVRSTDSTSDDAASL